MKKLLLVDGNSILFRAFYATQYSQRLTTSSGLPTNALFGFASMLTKALNTIEADYVIVAFDAGKETFRSDLYPAYKAQRPPVDESLVAQMPMAREYLQALGIKQYEQVGIEADDIIGSAARKFGSDYSINILSSDRDLLQLINDNTKIWMMKKGISEMDCVDEARLWEEHHLRPLQIIDWKGLAGDASDNIPGVTKVGDKTAVKLLEDYGSVEGVYENIDKIKGKLQENLIKDKEIAFLSKTLATIKTDAPLDIDINDCGYALESESANAFYRKYEIKTFINNQITDARPVYQTVIPVIVRSLPETIRDDEMSLFIDSPDDEPYGIALTNGQYFYYLLWEDAINDAVFSQLLASDKTKTVYDVKRWYHLLGHHNLKLAGQIIDTMLVSFLVDTTANSLDNMCRLYNIKTAVSYADVYNGQQGLFADNDKHAAYGCQMAFGLWQAKNVMLKQLHEKEMDQLYFEVELPLTAVLCDMEEAGIRVDRQTLDTIATSTQAKINDLQDKIYQAAGHEFNINSPKQLAEVLFDELHLASGRKRSTDVKTLNHLAGTNPIIDDLLNYRKYAKLYSTYAFGLQKYIKPDGKIHTVFNQCNTETGRLSSSDPNLQNISVRNEEASQIRLAFIPEPGCVLVGADYSQVELRMLADMAKETNLIEAFKQGMDIHTKTAMDVFNVTIDEVTPALRRQAKAINFGIDYGMTDYGLAERLDIPVSQAHDFIQAYYSRYPHIHQYMQDTIAFCQKHEYVKTLLNRRRSIPEINSSNHALAEFGKRAAMNAPIQGSAADLIKIAMINVANRLKKEKLHATLVLQIHDELILNVVEAEKDKAMQVVSEEMENAMKLSVPLVAEATSGNNWLEVK